jgi:hypothetical protein
MDISLNRMMWVMRLVVTGIICLITIVIIFSLFAYPGLLSQDGAVIYLAIYALAVLGYLVLIWFRLRWAEDIVARRQGFMWGVILSCLWFIEVASGNFATAPSGLVLILYSGSSLLAFTLPILGGFIAARQTGHIKTGTLVGLWGGLINGSCTCLILSIISILPPSSVLHDPQTLREFARSGISDIHIFILGDYLAAGINHLWFVGPALGTLAGTFGGLIGAQFAQPSLKQTNA